MSFEVFDYNTESFFNSGYTDGFTLKPDPKFTVLRDGLLSYYETYQSLKGNFYHYLDEYSREIQLAQVQGHSFLRNYFRCISFVQLFIELQMKELLENIDPNLITIGLNNTDETNIVNILLNNDFSHRPHLRRNHTVQYIVALGRVVALIENDSRLPANLKIPINYHFIRDNHETLKQMAYIRNDIVHKGNRVMTKYAFEVLFVNFIMPFIRQILRAEPQGPSLERNLFCRVNVLDEISKIKLPIDYSNRNLLDKTKRDLRHINHLKELGRASFSNQMFMGEDVSAAQFKYQEENVNKRNRLFYENDAKVRLQTLGCFYLHKCPCCGTKTLATYEAWDILAIDKTQLKSATCFYCSYTIHHDDLGEPKEFDLMSENIFVFVNTKNPSRFRLLWLRFKLWIIRIFKKLNLIK